MQFLTAQEDPSIPGLLHIQAEELSSERQNVHLIDVREPDEFTGELGHIPGAQLIPLQSLANNAARIRKLSQEKPVVFICRSGGRSGRATAWALQNGIEAVFNLAGGMLRWNDLDLDVEK